MSGVTALQVWSQLLETGTARAPGRCRCGAMLLACGGEISLCEIIAECCDVVHFRNWCETEMYRGYGKGGIRLLNRKGVTDDLQLSEPRDTS